MVARSALVQINGGIQEMPSGDTLVGTSGVYQLIPFFKADGTSSLIGLVTGKIPFFLASGAASNFSLT